MHAATRRCVLLTSHCSPDRLTMHREIVNMWLKGSSQLDIYLVDSYGCGIQDQDALDNPRFTEYIFSQEAAIGREACKRELQNTGPTNMEKYSILRVLRDVPRLQTYQYVFKITCKYYFSDSIFHAEYTKPLLVQDRHYMHKWQHSEVWGAPPRLMAFLMSRIPRSYLMERFMGDATEQISFQRFPPIRLLDTHARFNCTTLHTL